MSAAALLLLLPVSLVQLQLIERNPASLDAYRWRHFRSGKFRGEILAHQKTPYGCIQILAGFPDLLLDFVLRQLQDGKAKLIIEATSNGLLRKTARWERELTAVTKPPIVSVDSDQHYLYLGMADLATFNLSGTWSPCTIGRNNPRREQPSAIPAAGRPVQIE